MTLERPQNILLKINSIQDNIEYLNKTPNYLLEPQIVQSSNIFPSNNYFFQNYLNNNSKEDILSKPKFSNKNLFLNNSTTHTNSSLKFNSINNINNSINSLDNLSFKQTNNSLINLNIFNNNNNKLIEPKFIDEPKTEDNNIFLNKGFSGITFKESTKLKHRKICNKFKISKVEAKNKSSNRLKHKRKYKPDDIRKKIKARFHKSIKNIINDNLKKAGSKHFFSFLPQIFISSIARETNHQVLNLNYRELLQKDFVSDIDENKYKNKNVDYSKYKNNLRVLEYLDNNPEICKNSGFDIISRMKYRDLLDEYFKSEEFEKAIYKLREEKEEEDYINEYINKAKNYVKFFSELPAKLYSNKNKKNINK
jgi:hypothetical protein